jgi:hypothetical protein
MDRCGSGSQENGWTDEGKMAASLVEMFTAWKWDFWTFEI